MPLIVRTKILHELVNDEEWNRRLEQAKTSRDVAKVVVAFARSRGYKIKETDFLLESTVFFPKTVAPFTVSRPISSAVPRKKE